MVPVSQRIGTLGSAGQLMPGPVARIVKSDGSLAGYDEEGELQVKSPQIALRYFKNEQATKEVFLVGWVRTGDEVKLAKNGDFFVADRLKEILKVRGFQVAPVELEGHLLDHPDVSDACVVGYPYEDSGEGICRAGNSSRAESKVQTRRGQQNQTVYLKARVRRQGVVQVADGIAKNPRRKLLRRVMRETAKGLKTKSKL